MIETKRSTVMFALAGVVAAGLLWSGYLYGAADPPHGAPFGLVGSGACLAVTTLATVVTAALVVSSDTVPMRTLKRGEWLGYVGTAVMAVMMVATLVTEHGDVLLYIPALLAMAVAAAYGTARYLRGVRTRAERGDQES